MIHAGVLDGVVPHSVTRTGGGGSGQFTMPTVDGDGTSIKAGDFAVLADMAVNSTTAVPASVTPTGWNGLGGDGGWVNGSSNGVRTNFYYKLLALADVGATFTGMLGTAATRKIVMTFRMSRPVQTITPGGWAFSFSANDPASVDINTISALVGNVLVAGFGMAQNTVNPFSWSPAAIGSPYATSGADPLGSNSNTRGGYSYYPIGNAPANQSVDIGDFGNENTIGAGYFLLT